jgi:hypothetical protein
MLTALRLGNFKIEFPQMSFVPGLYRRPAYDVC